MKNSEFLNEKGLIKQKARAIKALTTQELQELNEVQAATMVYYLLANSNYNVMKIENVVELLTTLVHQNMKL